MGPSNLVPVTAAVIRFRLEHVTFMWLRGETGIGAASNTWKPWQRQGCAFTVAALSSARRKCCIKMGGWIGAGRNSRPSPRQLWIELAFTKGVENCFDRFWLKSRVRAGGICNANFMPGRFFHIFSTSCLFCSQLNNQHVAAAFFTWFNGAKPLLVLQSLLVHLKTEENR